MKVPEEAELRIYGTGVEPLSAIFYVQGGSLLLDGVDIIRQTMATCWSTGSSITLNDVTTSDQATGSRITVAGGTATRNVDGTLALARTGIPVGMDRPLLSSW